MGRMSEPRAVIDKLRTASSRAALVGNSYASLGVGEVVTTSWFAASGDGGSGNYIKAAGAIPAGFEANPAYVPQSDGTHLRLLPHFGAVNIHQFGGNNDSTFTGTPGTDNLGPLYAALAFKVWEQNPYKTYCYEIKFSAGHYWFSDTAEIHACVPLRGVGGGFEIDGSTYWHFPANKTFVIFGGNATVGEDDIGTNQGESMGSTMENIVLRGQASSTDHSRTGVLIRTIVHLKHISVIEACGNGFAVITSPGYINVPDFVSLSHCCVHSCTRHGLRMDGADSNVCHISHFSVHGNGAGGCGIWDSAYYGNKYDNIHIAGYGNQGVKHNGRAYRLLGYGGDEYGLNGQGELTEPGTDDKIWYDVGSASDVSDTQFPAWSATPTIPHRPQIPFLSNGAGHVIDNLYVEGYTPCHFPGATIATGGTCNHTKYSNHIQGGEAHIASPQGFMGVQEYLPGQPGYAVNGALTYAGVGTRQSNASTAGINILEVGKNGQTWNWYFENENMLFSRGRGTGLPYIFTITHPGSSSPYFNFGRDAVVPDKMALYDIGLINPGDAYNARIFGLRNAAPPAGYHAQGEWFFNQSAWPGYYPLGWSCTASGNPATWTALHLPADVSVTYDPPSLAPGAVSTIGAIAIAGAQLGDFADGSFSNNLQGVRINAWVSAADTVSFQFHNPTAGTIDLASGTLKLRLRK